MIAIAIAVTNRLATVTANATSPSEKLRRSFLVNLATSMATRPSTPTRSATTTPKIASRAVAIATTTTTEIATMMRTTMTNATLVAKTSLQTTIVRQSRVTMMERNQDKENYHEEEGRCGPKVLVRGIFEIEAISFHEACDTLTTSR
jgi:hypothetical protein